MSARDSSDRRVAAVDLGTNTVRLLVGEGTRGGGLTIVHAAQRVTRLGEGLEATGRLSPDAARRTLEVLEAFAAEWRAHGAEQVRIAATAAVREAANREAFARQVTETIGEPLVVLASEEEARLTVRGVQGGLAGLPAEGVLFDIGGGSTEFIGLRAGQPTRVVSLPVGVVKGREAFLPHDPVAPEAIRALKAYFTDAVTPVRHTLEAGSAPRLIGTAGTVTTLAAMDQGLVKYEPERVNAHVLTEAAVARLLEELSAMTIEQRRAIPVMEPGREDVIVAGAALTQVIMEVFGARGLLVSEYGLREGLVLELLVD
ncbi:MAG: hypothetical protein ACE5KY_05710 [Candidatus Tectimicrobiota bacterium]